MAFKFFIQTVHQEYIYENQDYKNINWSLLGKPKAKFKPANMELIESFNQKNPESEGNRKPNGQKDH